MNPRRKWIEFASSPAPRSRDKLYVSLNQLGIIAINRRTYLELGEPEAVTMLFDIDNLLIGLRPCELLMPNAFPIGHRAKTGTLTIRALSFTTAHQICPTGTIRFLNPEIDDGILSLDLNLTARTTQSPRTGWRKKNTGGQDARAPI